MTCPKCEGNPPDEGCDICKDGDGYLLIKGCPHDKVTSETRQLLQLCKFASGKGGARLPIAGGVLDQTQSFLDALSFYEAEEAQLKVQKNPLSE